MTIERVKVTNFQSLKDVDITLGKITIILGDSNSGKSAFMRAVNALGKGVRGSGVVTHGEKEMSVAATTEDWIVILRRAGTKTLYTVVDRNTNIEKDLPKSLGAVPEKVQEILGTNPSSYADQHDTPFLLKDSGAEVARKLGELTNVNTLLEAIRKGNTYKQRFADELKLRESDLNRAEAEIAEFVDLPTQLEEFSRIELLLAAAHDDEDFINKLDRALLDLEDSLAVLHSIKKYPDVPDISGIVKLYQIYSIVDELANKWENGERYEELQNTLIADADREIDKLHDDLHTLLVKAGQCPTCNQPVLD